MGKLLIYLCLTALLFSGCRTKKEVTRTVTVYNTDTVLHYRDRLIRDTVIKVAERNVRDTLTLTDTLIRYVEGKGITVKVQKRPDGRIAVSGNCDSLMILIQGLMQQRDSLATKSGRLSNENSELKQTTGTPWWQNILGYAAAAGIGLIAGFVIGFLKR